MKLLLEKTRAHLENQGETYFQHMYSALKIVWVLKTIEVKCIIHSICPFLYTTALSEKIDYLQKLALRREK